MNFSERGGRRDDGKRRQTINLLSLIESQQVNLHTYEAMIDREVFILQQIGGPYS